MERGWIWNVLSKILKKIYIGLLPPKKPDVLPTCINYTETYTALGGRDTILHIDGKVIGEAQNISWDIDLTKPKDEYPVDGKISLILFDRDVLIDKGIDIYNGSSEVDILMLASNECGSRACREIKNVQFVGLRGGISVDALFSKETYLYKAKEITPLRSLSEDEYQKVMEQLNEAKRA
jgi:hypothetical protein